MFSKLFPKYLPDWLEEALTTRDHNHIEPSAIYEDNYVLK